MMMKHIHTDLFREIYLNAEHELFQLLSEWAVACLSVVCLE